MISFATIAERSSDFAKLSMTIQLVSSVLYSLKRRDGMSEEKPKKRYVEVVRYEGFESEEEARRFMEEADEFFVNVHRTMRRHFQRMLDFFDEMWMPTWRRRAPKKFYLEAAEGVEERLTNLEEDVKEIKDLLLSKYLKGKKKEKEAVA